MWPSGRCPRSSATSAGRFQPASGWQAPEWDAAARGARRPPHHPANRDPALLLVDASERANDVLRRLFTEAWQRGEAPALGGFLELLESIDTELGVDTARQCRTDSRHGHQ